MKYVHSFSAYRNSPTLSAHILPSDATNGTNLSFLGFLQAAAAAAQEQPPKLNLNTHPLSGPIITELRGDNDSIADLEISQNNEFETRRVNRNSSNISDKLTTRLQRQSSFNSKTTESPTLPKRNQPTTLSAPSTLTKKSLDVEDKNQVKNQEVYV